MNGLTTIKPLAVLQTMMVPATNKRGLSMWALSPAFVNREGLGRQFVRDGRVVAEQWSVAQQPVLQDHDYRIAALEAFTPTTAQLKAEADDRAKIAAVLARTDADETQARKDADTLLRAGLDDERTGRLAGQQILATEVAALKARVAVLEAKPAPTWTKRRVILAPTLNLSIGGTSSIAVTWPTPFPDANYTVEADVIAGALGKATCAASNRTPTGCTINVTATGLMVGVGATVLVDAYRFTA